MTASIHRLHGKTPQARFHAARMDEERRAREAQLLADLFVPEAPFIHVEEPTMPAEPPQPSTPKRAIRTFQGAADERDDMEGRYEARWHGVMPISIFISGMIVASLLWRLFS